MSRSFQAGMFSQMRGSESVGTGLQAVSDASQRHSRRDYDKDGTIKDAEAVLRKDGIIKRSGPKSRRYAEVISW